MTSLHSGEYQRFSFDREGNKVFYMCFQKKKKKKKNRLCNLLYWLTI